MSARLATVALATGALTLTLTLAGCASTRVTSGEPGTPATPGVIPVVAAENFWGNIASQIGGAHVRVTSIISNPNTDPHSYETDPRDAAAISSAKFVILNGVGYDDFASKLLSASPNAARTVLNVQQINGVGGGNPNPHLWYSPGYVTKTAAAISAALSKVDPADAQSFETNRAAFLEAYQPYVAEIATIKAKYAGTPISYTERVPGYLVAAAGLTLGTPASFSQAVEDGDDPSPADTAVFNADITGRRVKVLLYNGQVVDDQTTAIKALATKSGLLIVGMTETLPAADHTFQAWQLEQATKLYEALGG